MARKSIKTNQVTDLVTAGDVPGENGITFSGLDPVLGSVGVMIGLLKLTDQDTHSYALEEAWFKDPIGNIKTGINNAPDQIGALLAQLLGEVGGNAVGIPVKDPALLGTWYSIQHKNAQGESVPTGLYIVSYTDPQSEATVIGIGALKKWGIPPGSELIDVEVWALIPFVLFQKGKGFELAFSEPGYPVSVGVAVEGGPNDSPLINENGIEFNGVKFSAGIDLNLLKFDVSLEVLDLQLAGDKAPRNYSLADLEAIKPAQLLNTAASLFIGALSKQFPNQAEAIQFMAPLFGLAGQLPKSIDPDAKLSLPILAWYDLFKAAADHGNPAQVFLDWFNSITSAPDVFMGWIKCLGGFLGVDAGQLNVTGDGSRNNPYQVPIIEVNGVGVLNFRAASVVVNKGDRYFYPGLAFNSKAIDLGSSPATFMMAAELELGQFQLSGTGLAADFLLNFKTNFSLQNKTAGQPLIDFNGDKVGSFAAGLSLGVLNGAIMPYLELLDVHTNDSSYDVVNLLSPGQLATVGADILSTQIQNLIGVNDPNATDFIKGIGVLIGLTKPEGAGADWPTPPFSGPGMVTSITRPIEAWTEYYYSILTPTGTPTPLPFTFILQNFAHLLKIGDTAVTVTGDGTPDSPWLVGISVHDASLPAYLIAFETKLKDDTGTALTLGFEFAPVITIAGVDIAPTLFLNAITINLPTDATKSATADWLPSVGAQLALPNGFQTPTVGGAYLKVTKAQLSAGWGLVSGWTWSMLVKSPSLFADGKALPPLPDLNFGQQTDLENLVKNLAATFGPFFASAAGIALMRTNTRAALLASGTLGLLTDFSQYDIFKNSGLSWSGFTQIPLTNFEQPFQILRTQVSNNLSTADKAKSQLALLSWALSSAAKAPAIKGDGTFISPYLTPLPFGFQLPVWFNAGTGVLGLGIGYADQYSYAGQNQTLAVDLISRLNALEYNLNTGTIVSGNAPSFSIETIISKPGGLLVNLPKDSGSVEKIILGINLNINGGQLSVAPIVTLVQAKLPGQTSASDITLDDFLSPDFTEQLKSAFQSLLNTGFQLAVDQVKDKALFKTAYNLSALMGLAIPVNVNGDGNYGINSGGWSGLIANPQGYIEKQLLNLVEDPTNRSALFSFLSKILHVNLPTLPSVALDLLAGLKLLGPAEQGYPISAKALLEIASDPINSMEQRFKALFDDAEALKALAKDLTQNLKPYTYGNFTFSATGTGVATLEVLPENAFNIGDFVSISGSLALDFSNQKLTATLNSKVPKIGFTLSDALSLTYNAGTVTPDFSASLIWGDADKPNAAPLYLLRNNKFNSADFVNEIAALAPAYTLNIFLTAVFEDQLLNQYPVVQSVFKILGIGKNDDGVWTMPSLLGILTHPLDWLLSDAVLGVNGKFNIAKLADQLGKFPSKTSANGIKIGPNDQKDGIGITGLPYSFEVFFSGDKTTNTAAFTFGVKEIQVAGGKAALDNLLFAIHITPDYQASFSGGLDLATIVGTSIFVSTGFDKSFNLKITQGTPASPGLSLQLLPFLGWGKLAEEAGALAAVEVIDNLVPKIITALKNNGAADFANALSEFGTNIPVGALAKSLISDATSGDPADKIVQAFETTSLKWLKGLFEGAQLNNTVTEIQALLKVPGIDVSVNAQAKGLLQYTPSEKLPLTIFFGLDENQNLGLWAGLDIPNLKYLDINVTRTGIGVDLATLSNIAFSFGFDLIIPLDGKNGPGIYLKYDPTTFFNVGFDPIADTQNPSQQSKLAREFIPQFFPKQPGESDDLGTRVTDWLLQVIKNVLPRYVSVLILNQESVVKWLTYHILDPVGNTGPTPVGLLEATTLITEETQQENGKDKVIYALNSIDNITLITPLGFLGNLLKELLKTEITVLKFGAGDKSVIVLGPNPNDPGAFGLRLTAPDLAIKALPNLVLQLGADDKLWITNSWSKGKDNKLVPGVQFYVPITTDPVEVDFGKFNLILDNIGFDFQGKNSKPLVDFKRFKLGAVKPRVLLDLKFNDSNAPTVTFGGNVTLADIGISLAPDQLLNQSSTPPVNPPNSQNPIASSLIGSGSDAKNADKNNPPTNPTFSVQAAYTDQLWVNLVSSTGEGDEVIIPVQRAFGPLFVESLGLGWENEPKLLDFIFTGNVDLAGLKISLIKLQVGIPVTTPTDFGKYTLDLAGMDVSYKGGSVVISGGFLKQDDPLQYIGAAVIQAGSFTILAMGAYAQIPNEDTNDGGTVTSMFIFGALSVPLGGPPAFFITGIAAGFGYNRSITIPPIEGVVDFILIRGVLDGSLTSSNDPNSALTILGDVVQPEVGQYWLAAGIKFSSFELINTAALLFVSFGKEFELNLLGLSWASLPPQLSKDTALAYFELAIKVSFKPAVGIISVEAQLTPNSFVLTKDCKVTGGFAFYLWYKTITQTINDQQVTIPAGQFVVTLGGYHPQFQAPVYFPSVPRLGLQWNMEFGAAKLSIGGGTYFAICPTAVMAGGYLKVLFVLGPIKAWLDAYANFLIEWHPFYFNVGIGITLGFSLGVTIAGVSVTLKFEIGATLQLQGPPVNGSIEVDLYIVSFTIPFGDQPNATKDNLLGTWDDFAKTFLPYTKDQAINNKIAAAMAEATDAPQQILKWNIGSGMLNTNNTKGEAGVPWIVNTMFYSLELGSVVPTNEITLSSGAPISGPKVGIRPMGFTTDLKSPIQVTLKDGNGNLIDFVARGISIGQNLDGAPKALWAKDQLKRDQAPDGNSMIISSALLGFTLAADRYVYVVNIPAFDINNLKYSQNPEKLLPFFYNNCQNPVNGTQKCFSYPPSPAIPQTKPYTTIMQTIMDPVVVKTRNSIYAALESVGIDAPANPDLSVMQNAADLVLQAFPVLAAIGCYQTGTPDTPKALKTGNKVVFEAPAPKEPVAPQLLALLRRYQAPGSPSSNTNSKMPAKRNQILGKWTCFNGFQRDAKQQPLRADANSITKNLYQGGAMVVQLDPGVPHILTLNGKLTVLAAMFDEYHNLLKIEVVNDVKQYPISCGTAQVALFSYQPEEHDAIGWQRDTMLHRVNAAWAVGDGCLLRVQNGQKIPLRKRAEEQGLIEADQLLRGNKVVSYDDQLSTGWIQTVLYAAKKYIAVLVEGADTDAVRVSIGRDELPVHPGKSVPTKTVRLGDQRNLLLFEAPENKEDLSFYGLIAASGDASQKIIGVYGLDKIEEAPVEVWASLSLHYDAMDISASKPKSTELTLTMA